MQNPKDEMYSPSTPAVLVKPQSLVERFAGRYFVEPSKLLSTLKATAFKQPTSKETGEALEITNEQMMMLLVVADQHKLNPFTREIYAFADPKRGGGIVPIVGIDGWSRIINSDDQFDGMDFDTDFDGKDKPVSCTCTIYRKDRKHPIKITEFYRECRRDTGPWTTHPARMLRHKAMIQCARVAFGFVGIYDEDEAERIIEGTHTVTHDAAIDELNATVTSVTDSVSVAPGPLKFDVKTEFTPPHPLVKGGIGSAIPPGTVVPPLDLTGGPNFADVLSSLRGAKSPDDVATAEDLARSLTLTEQQTAELDVEIRAAMKRAAK